MEAQELNVRHEASERRGFSGDDAILPFQVGRSAVRGRTARLGAAIDDILSAHRFPEPVAVLVGEAAALVAMMGSSLKFEGRLVLQAKGDGPVSILVADYEAGGDLRATATLSGAPLDGADGLNGLLGAGHFALTIDQGPDMERYQGVTPIEGASLADAASAYFMQSEQIPTAIRLAVGRVAVLGAGPSWRAGGVMAQFVPAQGGVRERGAAALETQEDEDAWRRAAALLATARADELLDPRLAAEELLFRLYHEDGVRVFAARPVRARCRCGAGKIEAVLRRYTREDLAELCEGGLIRVSCEFCRREYRFTPEGEEAPA
jgi:molecular chaperone Hsp33